MSKFAKTGLVAAALLALLPGLAWAVPTAVNQSLTVPPNLAAPGRLIYVSYSGASGTVTVTIVSKPAHGTLTPYGASYPQYFYYLPNAGYQGPDPFTWNVKDSTGTSNTAAYSITVANTVPKANNQTISVAENAVRYQFYLSYSDPDGQPLTFTLVSAPAHGSLEAYVYENGAYVYKPVQPGVPVTGSYNYRWCYTAQAGYTGTDSFTWKLNDGMADSNVATCSVSVNVNTPPVANSGSASVNCGTRSSVSLSVTDPDTGQLRTFTRVSGPSHGTVEMPAPTTSTYAYAYYISANDYVGTDSFTWKVNDGKADSNVATVIITVNPTPPVPQDQSAAVKKDTAADIPASFTGGGGYAYSVTKYLDPAHGTLTISGTTFRYTPAAGFVGKDSFQWKMAYGTTATAAATCTVLVKEAPAVANDWPQFRADEYRDAATLNPLPAALYQQWRRDLPLGKPINISAQFQYGSEDVSNIDPAYMPVAQGQTLFVGSNRNDCLMAFDTRTGAEKWRFPTNGPVRVAPVAFRLAGGEERVAVASDDGWLYCLGAADGALKWKVRGGPSDRNMLSNDRMVSVWAIRGAPTYRDGRIFFAAGLWPAEGVFLWSVDAATGAKAWLNEGLGTYVARVSAKGIGDGMPSFGLVGLMPAGYPVTCRSDDGLFYLPSGMMRAPQFSFADGNWAAEAAPRAHGYATWRVSGDWTVAAGADNYGIIGSYAWPNTPTIVAGSRTVTATDAAALGTVGTVNNMLAADARLFAVTTGGSIYCFGGTQVASPTVYLNTTTPLPSVSDQWTTDVAAILSAGGVNDKGLGMVWGLGSGRAMEELVKQSSLHVVGADANAATVAAARTKLANAALYGERCALLQADPMTLETPPYQAWVLVVENLTSAGFPSSGSGVDFVTKLFNVIRPYGGRAWLPTTSAQHTSFQGWVASAGLSNATVLRSGNWTVLERTGALAGSIEYTAANGTITNSDQLVKSPFAVSWASGTAPSVSSSGTATDGILGTPAPDVTGGRIVEYNGMTEDVYTGIVRTGTGTRSGKKTVSAPIPTSENPFYGGGAYAATANQNYGIISTGGASNNPFFWYDLSADMGRAMWGGAGSYCAANEGAWRVDGPGSMIPANGMFMLSKVAGGCCCATAVQVALGLYHRDDVESWITLSRMIERTDAAVEDRPLRKAGINFGAPGARMADDHVMWLEVPRHQPHMAPTVTTFLTPAQPESYYHHSGWMAGGATGRNWVAASGVKGVSKVEVLASYALAALDTTTAPVVDGSLADACWDGRSALGLHWNEMQGRMRLGYESSRTMARHDAQNLYLAIEIPYADWPRSTDEFVVTLRDREQRRTVSGLDWTVDFAVNNAGAKKVGGNAPAGDWTSAWSAAYVADANSVRCEMAIPWTTLEAAGLWGDNLLVNMAWYSGGASTRSGPHGYSFDGMVLRQDGYCPLYVGALRGLGAAARPYNVKLHFAETEGAATGQRVLNVKLQGSQVLSNLDVAAQAGGQNLALVKSFPGVGVSDKLTVELQSVTGQTMLSGVELVGTWDDADYPNQPPVALLDANPTSGAAPLAVNFSARRSQDPDGQIAECRWNFGDGATARGSKLSHVFAEPGTYAVQLLVLDDRGGMGSASTTVTVGAGTGPGAAFICQIRASGGDYSTLTAWEAAIESDLTAAGSLLFPVSNRGSYAATDDGTAVTFTGGATGVLKHINTMNVAYITGCTGTIQTGTVTCASGHTFSVSGTGNRINLAVAEGYNDWPTNGLQDKVTLAGWVTDRDHAVAIRPAAGQGHVGVARNASGQNLGFALYDAGWGTVIADSIGNVRVSGLVIGRGSLELGKGATVDRVIMLSGVARVGAESTISNSMSANGGVVFSFPSGKGALNSMIINCTAGNGGFYTNFGNERMWFVNCLAKPTGSTKGFDRYSSCKYAWFSHCASSDGTADDSDSLGDGSGGNVVNRTFSFVNAAQNDFRLAAADTGARGLGTTGIGVDIEGQQRAEPYDIGADEAPDGAPVAPAITSPLTASGTVGQPFGYTITATGTAPITFGATNLPAGLTRSGAVISGTPTASGTSSVTLTATNVAGTDTKTLVITVAPAANSAPVISSYSPASPAVVAAGSSQPFSVDAWDADGDALSYAWKLDGGTVGVTGNVFTYSPTAADAGGHSIEVTVSDAKGGSVKQTWSVTVTVPATPPSITTQPVSKTVTVGQTATFSVVAAGTAPLSYQWYKNSVIIGGATSASYTTPATVAGDNGAKFKVTVTNSTGSVTSSEATLTVNAVPTHTITASAGSGGTISPSGAVVVSQGGSQTFTIAPNGGYQIASVTVDGSSVGAVSTHTFNNVTANHTIAATFSAIVVPPSITTQPAGKTVTVGQTATFGVVATGTAPLSYQWYKNSVIISGATSASHTTPVTVLADNGATFKVTVTNSAGSVTSSEATLTVQSGGTPGLVTLRARDQFGADVSGAQVEVSIPYGEMLGTYDAGTQLQLTVGASYRFKGLLIGVLGPYTQVTIGSSTTEVVVDFWKATARSRDQFGTDVAGGQVRVNLPYTSTVLGVYSPGETVTLPRGSVADVYPVDAAGRAGARVRPTFDTGLDELVGQFWKTTIRCQDQNGATVPGAQVRVNVQYSSTVIAVCSPGDTVTLPRGMGVDVFGLLLDCTGARTQPKFDTGLEELVGQFWKATCLAKDAGGSPIPGASVKLTKPWYGAVIGTYPTGTVVTLPTGCAVWAYQVAGSDTGARLETVFQSPLTEVVPPPVSGTPVAPSITTQTQNAAVNVGQTATFSVVAAGTAPLSHQWQKNGANISGATSASYTTPATTAADNGAKFRVMVTNSVGSATSNEATLTVTVPATPPSITTQPANRTVTAGQTATFSVVANGTAPLSYQWQKNGVNISGATSTSYTTPATVASDNGAKFKVTVTTSAGSATSNEATLTVTVPTYTITASAGTGGTITPSGAVVVSQGGSQTFTIAPSGGYQIAGVTLDGTSVGAVSAYTFSNVTANHTIAATFSAAVMPPSITTQPAKKTVTVGQTATFSVVAAGTAPLSYQWQKNGVNISGATAASYTTPATTIADNGAKFRVTVTNSAGSVTSSEATLTVQSGATPGMVTLRARDQFGTDVAGARVEVSIPFGAVVGTYDAGTQLQLTVGTAYRFKGLLSGVVGPWKQTTIDSSMTEVTVDFWKATARCRDQYGTAATGGQVRVNLPYTSTVLGIYSPGETVTLPRGSVADVYPVDAAGRAGARVRPTFDTGLDELVGQFWKTTIRCRDQNGTDVAGAQVRLNVQYSSTVIGTYNPGDTVTLPRGYVVDAYGMLSGYVGSRNQSAFDTGLEELVGPFWKATCMARDAGGNPVPGATIKVTKQYSSTVIGLYASGTVLTLPRGYTVWAYQVVGAATGAKLEVTFQSPLTEVSPPAP